MIREEVVPLESQPDFAAIWESSQECLDCSFFTSAIWIQTWAQFLPDRGRAWLFKARDGDELQCLGLLVRNTDWVGRVLPIRRLWLHATGRPPLDNLTVEFNGVPSRSAFHGHAEGSLMRALERQSANWDQLMIPHSAHAGRWMAAAEACGHSVRAMRHDCFHVDFDALRRDRRSYENSLGKKTRYLLRRCRREIESEHGPIQVHEASSVEERDEYFDRMSSLHQQHWNARGKSGAFADATILDFHRSLLRSSSAPAACRMLRVVAGTTNVGYLYLFIWRRVAYFYQSGVNYDGIGHEKSPGYVTIAAVLDYLQHSDVSRFEFLAGVNLYKSRLGTGRSQLYSLEIQRRSRRNSILNVVRTMRDAVIRFRSRPTSGSEVSGA